MKIYFSSPFSYVSLSTIFTILIKYFFHLKALNANQMFLEIIVFLSTISEYSFVFDCVAAKM